MPSVPLPTDRPHMRPLRLTLSLVFLAALTGCTSLAPVADWEQRLHGDAIVLLGEVHDNAAHHQQRLDVLRRAFNAGWRPAIAMEQFDRERQADLERARREKPRAAQLVIDVAGLAGAGARGDWAWDYYRPFVELALEFNVPLIAANLSTAAAGQVVRGGYAAVFDAVALQALGLATPAPADLQTAQERAMDAGHCGALPPHMIPAMARGQLARDAVMAAIVSRHAANGIVLLAGNGHVRRDTGMPRWLDSALLARTLAVGYLEASTASAVEQRFDAVVRTPGVDRPDPCIAFKKRMKPP